MHGVIYVRNSENSKLLGSKPVDSTYASIKATCPDTCSLKGAGCYAESSFTGLTVKRLNKRARQHSPLKLARAEAQVINASYHGGPVPTGRYLRLHVSGDCRVIKGVRLITKAIDKWKARGGGDVWNYTHAWCHVPRKEWGSVSVLASIENVNQVAAARKQGYASAIIVPEHISDKAYKLPNSDVKWIPCVQQTKGVGCSDCKLCFNSNRLFDNNMGIAFAAHGINQNKIKRRLTVVP